MQQPSEKEIITIIRDTCITDTCPECIQEKCDTCPECPPANIDTVEIILIDSITITEKWYTELQIEGFSSYIDYYDSLTGKILDREYATTLQTIESVRDGTSNIFIRASKQINYDLPEDYSGNLNYPVFVFLPKSQIKAINFEYINNKIVGNQKIHLYITGLKIEGKDYFTGKLTFTGNHTWKPDSSILALTGNGILKVEL